MSYEFCSLTYKDLDKCHAWLYPVVKDKKLKGSLRWHLSYGVGLGVRDENENLLACAFWFYAQNGVVISYLFAIKKIRKKPILWRFIALILISAQGQNIFIESKKVWQFKRALIPVKEDIYRIEVPQNFIKRWFYALEKVES